MKLIEYDLLRNQLVGMIDSCDNLDDDQKVELENSLASIVDVNDYKHSICQSVMDVVPYALTGQTKKNEKADFGTISQRNLKMKTP